jgi:hypothetical protein
MPESDGWNRIAQHEWLLPDGRVYYSELCAAHVSISADDVVRTAFAYGGMRSNMTLTHRVRVSDPSLKSFGDWQTLETFSTDDNGRLVRTADWLDV